LVFTRCPLSDHFSFAGMIIAFSVNVPKSIEIMAAQNNVEICSSNIIYRLMDTVKEHVIKLLPVTVEKKVTGEAAILQIFEISVKSKQTMKVAGCRVTNGLVERSKQARVIRDGEIIHEGSYLDTAVFSFHKLCLLF